MLVRSTAVRCIRPFHRAKRTLSNGLCPRCRSVRVTHVQATSPLERRLRDCMKSWIDSLGSRRPTAFAVAASLHDLNDFIRRGRGD